MALSNEEKAALAALGLKEDDELYKLAMLLLATPQSPKHERGKAKVAWYAAVDAFLSALTSPKRSDGMTPLYIFIYMIHYITNPDDLLKVIRAKAIRTDIGQYDQATLLLSINNAIRLDVFTQLMSPPKGQTSRAYIRQLFTPFAHMPENEWLILLEKICTNGHSLWDSSEIFEALLYCKPHTQLNNSLTQNFFSTLCEMAVFHNNIIALKYFIPRTNVENRWQALRLSIKRGNALALKILLERDDDLIKKYAMDGHLLLEDYLSKSSSVNPELVKILLNAGCLFTPSIIAFLFTSQDKTLQNTAKFFAQKPSAKMLSETLYTLEHEKDFSLIFNARDRHGNTLFQTLFDTLIPEDVSYFDRLLHLIFKNNINTFSSNCEGLSIYTHPALSDVQKKCIQIAQNIRKAKEIFRELTVSSVNSSLRYFLPGPLLECEVEELTTSLWKMRSDIGGRLMSLPQDITRWINHFHFETLMLHLFSLDNKWQLTPEAPAYAEAICALMKGKAEQHLWKAFNDTLSYTHINKDLFSNNETHFPNVPCAHNKECPQLGEILEGILNILLKNLPQQPKTIAFTEEDFAKCNIQNPYKVAFGLNRMDMIEKLSQARLSPDVLNIDTNGNSLLNVMVTSDSRAFQFLRDISLGKCSISLALPNNNGNTPLHTACIAHLSNVFINNLLIPALITQNQNIDTLNNEHYSPLYLAIRANNLLVARTLLQSGKVSVHWPLGSDQVSVQYRRSGSKIITAFNLWAMHCTSFQALYNTTTEPDKINLKYNIKNSLGFAKLLLERGCHLDGHFAPLSIPIYSKLMKFKDSYAPLWGQEEQNPFIDFFENIDAIESAWLTITKIEKSGMNESYASIFDLAGLNLSNTRRTTDNNTMFEAILGLKIKLKTSGDATQGTSHEFHKRMSYLNKILASLIAVDANIQGTDDDNHKVMSEIVKKIKSLGVDINQAKSEIVKKIKDLLIDRQQGKDAMTLKKKKEDLEAFTNAAEASWRELAQQILNPLMGLEHKDYTHFKASIYFHLAKMLFWTNQETNSLQISGTTLKFSWEIIQQTVTLSEQFEDEDNDLTLRTKIITLNANISRCVSTNPYIKMQSLLMTVIPQSEERTLRQEDPKQWAEVTSLLSSYADGQMNPSLNASLCTLIPDALQRGDKKIDVLNKMLEVEALKKEKQALQLQKEAFHRRMEALEKQLESQEKQEDVDPTLMGKRQKIKH